MWYNSYVTHHSNVLTDTVIQQFILLYITQVKHLCKIKSYEPQFWSKWMFESFKREISETSLLQHWKDALHTSSCCGTDAFIYHVADIEIFSKK